MVVREIVLHSTIIHLNFTWLYMFQFYILVLSIVNYLVVCAKISPSFVVS
jgi:uncharacterized membrane protein (DUF373 family)